MLRSRSVVLLLGVSACILLTWKGVPAFRHSGNPPAKMIVTASGQRLSSLFEGRSPNPLYTLKNLSRTTESLCLPPQGWTSRLLKFLGEGSVYAQSVPNCTGGQCNGSYWYIDTEDCPIPECDGYYNLGQIDYERSNECFGIKLATYTLCNHAAPGCPCTWNTHCDSCP
jgi:hypothetical protein